MPPKRATATKSNAPTTGKRKNNVPAMVNNIAQNNELDIHQTPKVYKRRDELLREIIHAEPATSDLAFELRARERLLAKAASSASSTNVPASIRSAGLSVLNTTSTFPKDQTSKALEYLAAEPLPPLATSGIVETNLKSLQTLAGQSSMAMDGNATKEASHISSSTTSSATFIKEARERFLKEMSGKPVELNISNFLSLPSVSSKSTNYDVFERTSSAGDLPKRKSTLSSIVSDSELFEMERAANALPAIANALFLYANLYWTQIGGAAGARWLGGGGSTGRTSSSTNLSSSSSISSAQTQSQQATSQKIRSVPVDEKMFSAVSPRCSTQVTRNHIEYVCKVFPYYFEVKWTLPTPRLYFNHFFKSTKGGASGEAVPTINEFRDSMLERFGDSVAMSVIAVSSYEIGKRQQEAAVLTSTNKEIRTPFLDSRKSLSTTPHKTKDKLNSINTMDSPSRPPLALESSGSLSSVQIPASSNTSNLFPSVSSSNHLKPGSKRQRSPETGGDRRVATSDNEHIAKNLRTEGEVSAAPVKEPLSSNRTSEISPALLSVLSDDKRRQVESALAVEDMYKYQNLSEKLQNKINIQHLLSCFDLILTLFHTKNYIYGHALINQLLRQNAHGDAEEVVRQQIVTLVNLGMEGSGLLLQSDPWDRQSKASATQPTEPEAPQHPSHLRVEEGSNTPETIINGVSLDRGIILLNLAIVDRKALAVAISKL